MRRYFAVIIACGLFIFFGIKAFPIVRDNLSIKTDNGISYIAKVDSKSFYVYQYGKWQQQFVKGVNIGAGKPGYFPGEVAVTKDEYLRWFKEISSLNANTIRVYTILSPNFYDALYEYNSKAVKPLYVMQGVWLDETDTAALQNAYASKISEGFKSDIKTIIDIIHGKAAVPPEKGHASGIYTKDVSKYISGWIIGVEWDPGFVQNTNSLNSGNVNYDGKYLYSKNASPFENWLTSIGDYAISYESEKYNMQRPLSFTNWVTTDMLKHPNEPLENEDLVSVNMEHVKAKPAFLPGCFASYHIYPYYPDSMSYQQDYAAYRDASGKINTYEAYLKDLRKEHTMPVLVAEFGVPSARGKAHDSLMGYNQGDVSETDQGNMDAVMLKSIYEQGYMGGIVFTWQDEWFKRTWNTMDYDLPDRRAYWSNPQTNEQQFGLLAFDPGTDKSTFYVDGDSSDWKDRKPVTSNGDTSVYAESDEKYVYFRVHVNNFNINKDKILIPIDSIDDQGNMSINKADGITSIKLPVGLKRAADFVIQIDGRDNSRMMVDSYYDSFYYTYSKLGMIPRIPEIENKNSGIFDNMYLCTNRGLYLPDTKQTIPFSKYETGKLKFGNGNPEAADFDSLSDFIINGDDIEIRIPWQLFNVMDPSSKMNMDDLYKNGIAAKAMNGINIGGILIRDGQVQDNLDFGKFDWKKWDQPRFHERLKQSYYILQRAFKEIGGSN